MSDPHNPDALKEAREAHERWTRPIPIGARLTFDDPGERLGDTMRHLGAALAEVDRLTADLSALRIEHEAHAILLDCARRDRDEARKDRDMDRAVMATPEGYSGIVSVAMAEEIERLRAHNAELRIEHEAVCGLLTHTRRDRDEARKERDDARTAPGECFLLSGADPDGDDWRHNWPHAVDAVRELRKDYDEECGVPAHSKPAHAPVVILGDGNDLHRLAHALRGDPVRDALDNMPVPDPIMWVGSPTNPNRAQRRGKDRR